MNNILININVICICVGVPKPHLRRFRLGMDWARNGMGLDWIGSGWMGFSAARRMLHIQTTANAVGASKKRSCSKKSTPIQLLAPEAIW